MRRCGVTRFTPGFILSLLITLLFAASTVSLGAQTGSLTLEGIVWDPQGNPLSGAILTAVQESTGRQTEVVTYGDGAYRFLVLEPGTYTVTVKAKGFKDVI